MLNTMKLALVLALLMLSLGQTLSNLQPVAHQSEYTKDIIAPPLERGLNFDPILDWRNITNQEYDKLIVMIQDLQHEMMKDKGIWRAADLTRRAQGIDEDAKH